MKPALHCQTEAISLWSPQPPADGILASQKGHRIQIADKLEHYLEKQSCSEETLKSILIEHYNNNWCLLAILSEGASEYRGRNEKMKVMVHYKYVSYMICSNKTEMNVGWWHLPNHLRCEYVGHRKYKTHIFSDMQGKFSAAGWWCGSQKVQAPHWKQPHELSESH